MPFHKAVSIALSYATMVVVAIGSYVGAARAQTLVIQPMSLEILSEGSDPILAAVPTSSAAPVILGARDSDATVVAAAVQPSDLLPTPSIILGYIAPEQEAAFNLNRLLPATVEQIAFALDDLAAREALRQRDPELFRRLIEEGHLDPGSDDLNRVLQVELQRMNCYRSTIDGLWGPGSRGSVDSYFDQLDGVSWPDPDPSNELFRAVILNGDVVCPAPVARRAAERPASNQARPRTQQAPAQRQPARTPSNEQKINPSGFGSGVFR